MDSSQSHYESLCHAYFDGAMTLEEEKTFFDTMQTDAELLKCFEGYLALHQQLRKEVPQDPSPLLEGRIMDCIRQEASNQPVSIQRARKAAWKAPIAAAILGVLVISSFILGNGLFANQEATLAKLPNVQPKPMELAVNISHDASEPKALPQAEAAEFDATVEDAWHDVGSATQDLSYLDAEVEWLDPTAD